MSRESLVNKKLKNFNVIGVLGSGNFAIVYQAIDQITQKRVAIKTISIELIKKTAKLKELVQTEIKVLKSCQNQNVIKHIASFKSDKNVFIVTQFCNGGDLQNYLNKKKRLSQTQATQFLKQILNGFKGLHQVKAMHRDFKLANVLIHNKNLKIADLGFAKQLEKEQSLTITQLGSRATMAPQVLEGKPYGMIADIWSIGVVFYQMIYGEYPYVGKTDFDILKKIRKGKIQYPFEIKISTNAKNFIDRCLTANPQNRISWRQIYGHNLLTSSAEIPNTTVSRIRLKQNQEYYIKNEVNPQKKFVYPQKQNFITQGYEIKQMQKQQFKESQFSNNLAINGQKNNQLGESRKKIEVQIEQYQKVLLKKRNNIMFMFRFFIPKIAPYIQKFTAIHNIALFFICKKTLIEMQGFINELNEKKVIKDKNNANYQQKSFLKVFFQSKSCQRIINLLLQDVDMIKQQCYVYMQDFSVGSPQIQIQLADITRWQSQNWQIILNQVFDQYWYQIAQNMNIKQTKKQFIEILRALQYYHSSHRSRDDLSVQQFQLILQTIDYEQYQEEIDRKLFEVFK